MQAIPVGSVIPTGGTIQFEIFGEKSIVLPWNANTNRVQSAINAIPAMRRKGLITVLTGAGADVTLGAPTVSYSSAGTDVMFKAGAVTSIGFAFYPVGPVDSNLILYDNTTGGTGHLSAAVGVKNLNGIVSVTGAVTGALPAKIFYLRLPSPFDQEGLYLGAVRPDQPIILRIRTADARKFGDLGAQTNFGTFGIMTNPGLNLLMQCTNIPPDDKKEYNTYWNSPGRRWKKEVCYLFEPASATTLAYSGKTPRIKLDTLQDVICSKAILIPHFGRSFTGFTNLYGGLASTTTAEELNNTTSTNYFYLCQLGTPVSPAQIWLENANGVQIFTGNGKYTEWHQKVNQIIY